MSKRSRKTPATRTEKGGVESGTPQRYALIDALRGFAIVLMIAYHASFDLNYHGWIHQDFNNSSFWLASPCRNCQPVPAAGGHQSGSERATCGCRLVLAQTGKNCWRPA